VAETIRVPAARRGFAERERRLPGFPPHRTEALPFLAQRTNAQRNFVPQANALVDSIDDLGPMGIS
jgi:hypothetical protein